MISDVDHFWLIFLNQYFYLRQIQRWVRCQQSKIAVDICLVYVLLLLDKKKYCMLLTCLNCWQPLRWHRSWGQRREPNHKGWLRRVGRWPFERIGSWDWQLSTSGDRQTWQTVRGTIRTRQRKGDSPGSILKCPRCTWIKIHMLPHAKWMVPKTCYRQLELLS